jgi:membrane-associated phospholipid phosphatase
MTSEVAGSSAAYFTRLFSLVSHGLFELVRTPSHSRRAQAARHWARRSLALAGIGAVIILGLMYLVDAYEIGLMPKRGTAGLWPVRILTDFGKSDNVLWTAGIVVVLLALAAAGLRQHARAVLISLTTRMSYIFLAVLFANLISEIVKGIVGRGRPFVGGAANPFNFSHFAWSEAYASFPSGHATTSVSLAFAVVALWPRMRGAMIAYALAIAATRLVLLAHHPSDVVAGALVGIIGAMCVRYWFAARHLAFTIHADGTIEPLPGPSWGHLKGVARGASAP